MAKRIKRQVPAASVSPTSAGPVERSSGSSYSSRISSGVEFKPDYSHAKKDLKQIAYMASGFVVVLVVLSFFLG